MGQTDSISTGHAPRCGYPTAGDKDEAEQDDFNAFRSGRGPKQRVRHAPKALY